MAVTLVQSALGSTTGNTAALPSPPTPGNLLVVIWRKTGNGLTQSTVPAGWVVQESGGPLPLADNGTFAGVATRVAQTGDTGAVALGNHDAGTGRHLMIVELAKASGMNWRLQSGSHQFFGVTNFAVSFTPAGPDGMAFVQWIWSQSTTGTRNRTSTPGTTFFTEHNHNFAGHIARSNGALPAANTTVTLTWGTDARDVLGQWFVVTEEDATVVTPPVANAGSDGVVNAVALGTLDGSASQHVGAVLWEQTSGPSGATIHDPNSLTTTVAMTQSGAHTFRLTVTNSDGNATDTVVLTPNLDTSNVDLVWNSAFNGWE